MVFFLELFKLEYKKYYATLPIFSIGSIQIKHLSGY